MQISFLSVALKNLRRKPVRTLVLVCAIALFVALLVFAASFSISITSTIDRVSQRLGADIIAVPVGARTEAQEFLLEARNRSFYMPSELLAEVKGIEGVRDVTHQTYISSIDGLCCDVIPTGIVAFDPATDFIVKPWLNRAIGRELLPGEAIAGAGTAENLGLGLLNVEATLFNQRFTIVGELEATGTGLDNALFMTVDSLQKIIDGGYSPLAQGQISVIFIRLEEGLDPDYMGRVIEGQIYNVDVVTRSSMGVRWLNTLADINRIFLVTISLSSMLTIFLVWSIFTAMAGERAREIGIMRAIGARQAQVAKLFFLEIGLLGAVGSLLGVLGGTWLAVRLAADFELMRSISAGLEPGQQLLIGLGGLLVGGGVCLAGALIPVNRIKKIEPLLAIKEV
ncbi:ABC transporter permease [Desulfurivibrio sp. D14AmB]|uniref:ABC transporter permease n=1 Tax=Desulfurivibrio sp. D14AmB TaxID=3374370 RepID=UPI00376EB33B